MKVRNFWLRLFVIGILTLALVSILNSCRAERSSLANEQKTPNFKVSGTKIYTPNGKEFIIKGVNINGPNWVWPDDMTQDVHLKNIVDCWKFNLVRVNSLLYVTNKPYPQFQDNNDTDKLVNAFTRRGVVVMFEAHDKTGSYYTSDDGSLQDLKNCYRELAKKYKNNPYVWFDVMNEPGDASPPDKAKWLTVHREVIKTIRDEVGANNIIMVEGNSWGQDAGNWDTNPVPWQNSAILRWAKNVIYFNGKTYKNIIFNIHVYAQYLAGGNQKLANARLADYFDRVLRQNVVITVGEFGTDAKMKVATQAMYNTAVPRKIGRIAWAWWGGDDNRLTLKKHPTEVAGGWKINSCTNPTNLSLAGQQVWKDTHSR